MKALTVLVSLLSVFCAAERMQFMQTIMPSKQQCFLESMQEKMTAKIQVTSDARMMTYVLTDPKGKKVNNSTNKANYEHTLVANMAGNYQLCITNGHKVNATINFQIESGVEAIDYSNIVQK